MTLKKVTDSNRTCTTTIGRSYDHHNVFKWLMTKLPLCQHKPVAESPFWPDTVLRKRSQIKGRFQRQIWRKHCILIWRAAFPMHLKSGRSSWIKGIRNHFLLILEWGFTKILGGPVIKSGQLFFSSRENTFLFHWPYNVKYIFQQTLQSNGISKW